MDRGLNSNLDRDLTDLLRHQALKRKLPILTSGFAKLNDVLVVSQATEREVEEIVNSSLGRGQPRLEIYSDLVGVKWIRATYKHSLQGMDRNLVNSPGRECFVQLQWLEPSESRQRSQHHIPDVSNVRHAPSVRSLDPFQERFGNSSGYAADRIFREERSVVAGQKPPPPRDPPPPLPGQAKSSLSSNFDLDNQSIPDITSVEPDGELTPGNQAKMPDGESPAKEETQLAEPDNATEIICWVRVDTGERLFERDSRSASQYKHNYVFEKYVDADAREWLWCPANELSFYVEDARQSGWKREVYVLKSS